MAKPGLFDPELTKSGLFAPDLNKGGLFDKDFIVTTSAPVTAVKDLIGMGMIPWAR